MTILSQFGHADGAKTQLGIELGYIGGVIFRPRDISPEKFTNRCNELRTNFPSATILFDPQLYAGVLWNDANHNFGKLEEYEDYFGRIIRGRLEIEKNVQDLITKSVEYQFQNAVTDIISPNVLIRKTLDSSWAVISKIFLRNVMPVWSKFKDKRKVFGTIAISRDALLNRNEFTEFLNDITSMDDPPDGFYILIEANSTDARSDIFNSEVIAAWMMLNYSLRINGFKVINGYSDLISPLLTAVGGEIGSTGWWSNTRAFSLEQFMTRQTGGSLPIQRYLSKNLLNRIRFDELRAWYRLVPEVLNGLETDEQYTDEENEPERAKEVLQSWQALTVLCKDFDGKNVKKNLEKMEAFIQQAKVLYSQLESVGIRPDIKSNRDHLEPMSEGIALFKQLAEI